MNRINITTRDEETGAVRLVGWFDAAAAEHWDEDTEWDGSNRISVATGSQWDHERLYRTAGGRFVLNRWSQWRRRGESYKFVGSDRAREWLALNGHDGVIERLFGEPLPSESGPGRPEIGPMVNVRMPQEWINRLDQYAGERGESRARTIRRAVVYLLAMTEEGAPENDFPAE